MRFASAVLLMSVVAAGCASAQVAPTPAAASPPPGTFARADTASLHRTLDSLARAHRGTVGYAVHNVDTGERFSLRGDEPFPTASLVKVPILVTVYDLVEKGTLRLEDPLTVLKIDQVPGSGVLQFMLPGLQLTVRDAAYLMTVLSDNTATNLLLDRVVIRRVWQKMETLGLPRTKVHSKVFLRIASVAPDSSVKYGLGVSTPNEMAQLFTLIAQGRAVSPRADSAMLAMLADNQDNQLLQRAVEGLSVPHKTGMTDSVRTECALFPLQSRVSFCVFTKQNADTRWIVDNDAQVLMGRMGSAVVRAWPRRERRAQR